MEEKDGAAEAVMAEEKEQLLLQPSKTLEEELFAAVAAVEVDIDFA